MSGPKVVRIQSEAELRALREDMLRLLERDVERWLERAHTLQPLEQTQRTAVLARRERLRVALTSSDNAGYARQVEAERAWLRADLDEREAHAIEQRIAQRQRSRRQQQNAATVLNALRSGGLAVDAALLQALTRLAEGGTEADAEGLLARATLALAADVPGEALSPSQRNLAQALREDGQERNATWQAPAAERDPRLQRIDRHIAELQLLQGAAPAASFEDALRAAEAEPNTQRRNLLLDSLVLDLASAAATCRQQRTHLTHLHDLAHLLDTLDGDNHRELLRQIADADASVSAAHLQALTVSCQHAIDHYHQVQAAASRRAVLLAGLAELGYEVREGMATAWSDQGRVVLRRPASPGYGVELGGNAGSGRLQIRAVAMHTERDRSRDRDVEAIWCGDFSRLKAQLHAQGSDLQIERALGVGEVPLKEVEASPEPARVLSGSASRPRQA
ncbi:hypothetical protein IAE57_09440 [Stenotrophomonas sp. S48]|uniref:hypothetical protein n=1 Tax=unclassified Stenotrophomonas TaxID=196198 RepID=UPI00190093CC|nr:MULTISPECIES: hypothetical protein [unclassified Stenotrophomonas]MBK0026388.1 hypothetical protein [Stenotrophomonas sp. S48]MBK0047461.1 hypothetical protein [Stenotrophomonas sp. S49]